jgi:hypothetical protein
LEITASGRDPALRQSIHNARRHNRDFPNRVDDDNKAALRENVD